MNYKVLFKDATITFSTQIFTAISGLIIMSLLSRNFGLESYGNYYAVKRVSDILWLFFLFGMTVSIPRNKSFVDKTNNKGAAELALIIFPLMSITLFFLFSDILLELLLKEMKRDLGIIVSLMVSGMIIYGTISSYLRAISNFKLLSFYTLINFSVIPLFPLFYSTNIQTYLIQYASGMLIINSLIYILFSLYFIKNSSVLTDFKLKFLGILQFMKYGIQRLPGLFLASLIFTLPIIILSYIGTEKEIGSLGQVFQLFSIISMPINALGLILLPSFSKVIADGNIKDLRRFLIKGINFLLVSSTFMSILLIVFLSEILYLINGNRVSFESLFLIRIMILMIVPYSLYTFLRNPIDAGHKFPFTTTLIIYAFISSISLTFLIFMTFNLSGLETSVLLTTINLLLLGIGAIFYTKKLYFNKE